MAQSVLRLPVAYRPEAQDDLDEVFRRVLSASQSFDVAEGFVRRIKACCERFGNVSRAGDPAMILNLGCAQCPKKKLSLLISLNRTASVSPIFFMAVATVKPCTELAATQRGSARMRRLAPFSRSRFRIPIYQPLCGLRQKNCAHSSACAAPPLRCAFFFLDGLSTGGVSFSVPAARGAKGFLAGRAGRSSRGAPGSAA